LAVSLLVSAVGIGVSLTAVAGPYDSAAASGTNWLTAQRNVGDGSWGASDDVKYVRTSEAVLALAALNQLTPAYHAGVAWLGNHTPANVDFTARRVLATEQGHALYRQRQHLIETLFGSVKHNRGLRSFHRRGRAAVRTEWRLITATHNLLKLHTHQLKASTA